MMASGAFATLNINFNVADDYPEREIFPFARKQNIRVVVREAFIKGVLFRLAREAGIGDDRLIARAGMKWLASRPGIDSVIMGPDEPMAMGRGWGRCLYDRGGSLLCGHNGGVKFALLCLLTLRRCATDAADIERPKFGAL
jgi:hypothetical protein